jgi:protein SCO1/2
MLQELIRWLGIEDDDAHVRERARRSTRIGDRYANVRLTDQFGRTLRFHDHFVVGRALIVNTMYTTCRDSCPVTSARLASLRKVLSPVFGDRLSIVSLTLEPHIDTPGILHGYADVYGANDRAGGLCEWQFLTGHPDDVDRLRRSLGFYDLDPVVDRDPTRHASLLLFGHGQTDRWAYLPAELDEHLLVESIRRIAGVSFEQRYGIRP